MSILPIIETPDPRLRTISKPVDAALIVPMMDTPLWQAPVSWGVQSGTTASASLTRRAHPTFIEEFLDQIGVPMGVKLGNAT